MSLHGAAVVLLAFVIYYFSNSSGFKLCAINKFHSERPVLSNVTLHPERVGSSPFRSVYAIVSGHRIRITSDAYSTRIETRKWGQNGAMVGSYVELDGELLCRYPDVCPPMTSSGDYIGIPTIELAAFIDKSVLDMVTYTIFHLPALEESAQDWRSTHDNFMCYTQVKKVWGDVIEHFCDSLVIVLVVTAVGFVLLRNLVFELSAQTPRHPFPVQQNPTQGEFFSTL